jgi:outer membrane protein assembly factor BamA
MRRLGNSDDFLALRWIYLDLESRFDPAQPRPDLPERSFAQRSSGLGIAWEHDSRDTIFTPSQGWKANVDGMFYAPSLGSDNTYQVYRAHVFAYLPVGGSLVLGGRLDARAARGDVPFYQKPFIDMRGIPAVRYQDDNTAVAEMEARWNVTPRWALVGFLGAGRAWSTSESFGDAGSRVSKGIGVRYFLAKRLGMYVGIDYARGPEQGVYYLQVGNAWH